MEIWPIGKIKVDSPYARLNTDVESLMESIKTLGLMNPLTVNTDGTLIAGGRRYHALRELKFSEVPVNIVDKNELEQELMAIDENLMRKDLTGMQFEAQLSRAKELYEQLNPDAIETELAGDLEQGEETEEVESDSTRPFVEVTADKIGMSPDSLRKAIRRNQKASSDVKVARENGEIGATQTNEIIVLTAEEQNMLLPHVGKRPVREVRELVQSVQQRGIDNTLTNINAKEPAAKEFKILQDLLKKANRSMNKIAKDETLTMGDEKAEILRDIAMVQDKLGGLLAGNTARPAMEELAEEIVLN